MSKGNHTVLEVATFLNRNTGEVKEAFDFMITKGVFAHRFPSASQATAWARKFTEKAEEL
jgi:hypothetical protein